MFISTPGPSGPLTAGQHPSAHISDDNGWSSQAPRHILPASDHHHNPDLIRHESSSENNTTQGKKPNHIRRPANSFILFRKDFVATRPPGLNSEGKTLSKLAGEAWGNLPSSQKRKWIDAAKEESEEHARAHPDWKYRPAPRSAKSRRQSARASPYPSLGDRASTQSSPDASKRTRVSGEGPSNYRIPVSVPQSAPNRLLAVPQPSEDLKTPLTNTAVTATPPFPEDIWSQRSSVPVAQTEFTQAHRTHQSDYLYAYGREGYTNLRSEPSFLSSSTSRVPGSSRVPEMPPIDGQSLYDGQLRVPGRASMQAPAINWDMIRVPLRDESISPYSALDSQSTLTPLDIALDMFPYSSPSTKFENIEPPTGTVNEATALEGGSTTGVELPSLYSFGDESLYRSGTESSTHINKLFSDFSSHIEQQSTNVENYDRDDHIIERYHDSTSGNILSLFPPTTAKGPEGQA